MSRNRGNLFVLAGPSGAGKTTLSHHLVKTFSDARFSVSVTTRPPRGSEQDGVDYRFVRESAFQKMVDDGFFLEHALVHGHRYGTSREWVEARMQEGTSVILDIDVQGALQVRESYPSSVLVFILPPEPAVLTGRLRNRNTDSPETVRKRMEAAAWESGWIGYFDYYLRNGDLDQALEAVEDIYSSQGRRLDSIAFPEEVMALDPESFKGLDHWSGRRVVVTSGPTRENVDEVRFISNRSSGLMGRCMAEAFRDAGAEVCFITGPACIPPPGGTGVIRVDSTAGMLQVLRRELKGADLLVMTAAVADFTPDQPVRGKLKRRNGLKLALRSTPDILATLKDEMDNICPILAFALEMGDGGEEKARRKMVRKGADAIFLNPGDEAGIGMEHGSNRGKLITKNGETMEIAPASKRYVSQLVCAAMGRYFVKGSLKK